MNSMVIIIGYETGDEIISKLTSWAKSVAKITIICYVIKNSIEMKLSQSHSSLLC
jgi:hypothetical protein